MCGIVAYLGHQKAVPFLLDGLSRLEYRGYDSAGIAIIEDSELHAFKKKGKVIELRKHIGDQELSSNIGIGHTRWATHGQPNDINAHPHTSMDGKISIIHNGIIENYQTLKKALEEKGYKFQSETDTEVVVHLIQEYKSHDGIGTQEALRLALNKVVGAYAIVLIDQDSPGTLFAARKSSPMVFGIGEKEYFLASDIAPISQHTNQFIFLEDEQMIRIEKNGDYTLTNLDNIVVEGTITEMDIKLEELEKDGYPHYMLKEIFQQPKTVRDSMRGRINTTEGWVSVGGLTQQMIRMARADRMIFVACGTSWHTALIAEYLFEDLARIPCEVEYASEFRYRNPILEDTDVVLAISQSGETADTLAALELAKQRGALTYGIVNVIGSSIARITDTGSYTHAGPEIGVASTKAFTSQLTVLTLMAIQLGRQKETLSQNRYIDLINALEAIPKKIEYIFRQNEKIKYIAGEIKSASNALYLGRGYNFPVALEGALKLKEISYIHAEGYPAAEMKHGPIALIDLYMPVICIATNMSSYDKIISNIEEVKARKGVVIAIINEGDTRIKEIADYYIEIPETPEALTPLLSVVPLQLLAYHIAVMRGCNVDQPRNLAKSVTVE
ncbi:MAG: glucosamine--fructose-6-phosphate aminotransferase (isomerizing) [Saprospiraceae bacterium]|jgi:glucosamine--fructose-6-phosphate aminotransferase (isomerizing)